MSGSSSAIDPSGIPGDDLNPDAVAAAATSLATGGASVRDAGANVLGEWRGLASCYEAPESAQLFAVMDPVEAKSREFGDDVEQVAAALTGYAGEIRPIKAALTRVKADAVAFRARIAANPEWQFDQVLVDENTALLRRVNTLQVALWDAERTCANSIRALSCMAPWHASTGEGDSLGYGASELGAGQDMAWGQEVQRRDACPKSAAVSVKRFVWDGLACDGIGGTFVGLGTLVGIDGTGWHWDTMKSTWGGMSSLIGYANGEWSWGNAGDGWGATGKGMVSWDEWKDDPARAAGGSIFNVATLLIPVAGAAVNGTKVAATAGKTGRAATILARAGEVVNLADPVTLVARGAKMVLPKLGDLLPGIRLAAEGLHAPGLHLPDLHALDIDVPTAALDDLADAAPKVHDLPTMPEHVPVTEAAVPARVLEHAGVGNGQVPETPGGLGRGADDLLHRSDPGTPGSSAFPDAPTGGHSGGVDTLPHADGFGSGLDGAGEPPVGHGTADGIPGSSPLDDAAPGAGMPGDAPPPRIYGMADGVSHDSTFAPEQVDRSHAAQHTIDRMLGDASVFERNGLTPWTRAELVTKVMTPVDQLTGVEKSVLRQFADALPAPKTGDAVQKVLTPDGVTRMLDSTASESSARGISGSITRLEDAANLDSVSRLQTALRLDYPDSPFLPQNVSEHVVRFRLDSDVAETSRFSDMGGNGGTDGWNDPYTGNGFLKSGDLIPEYRIDESYKSLLPENAEMWEVLPDRTQRLTAVLRGKAWVRIQ